MKLIYLASPYSKYPGGREAAYKEVCIKAAELMQQVAIFCPIAHSHSIELEGMNGTIKDGDWWLKQDFAVLKRCDELWVYQMPGWEESYGVTKEIMFALNNHIPIKMIPYVQNSIKVSAPVSNHTITTLGGILKSQSEQLKPVDLHLNERFHGVVEPFEYLRNSNYPGGPEALDEYMKRVVANKALQEWYDARDV